MVSDVELSPGIELAYARLSSLAQGPWRIGATLERWHVDGTFSHLKVRLERDGGPGRKLALNARGEAVAISVAESEYARVHAATWGAILPDAARYLEELSDVDPVRVAAFYDPAILDEVALRLWDPSVAVDARLNLATLSLRAFEARALGATSGVVAVDVTEPVDPSVNPDFQDAAACLNRGNSADYTGSDETYNADGFFANDIRVGILESISGGDSCGILDTHEAFAFANVEYFNTPRGCATNADCGNCFITGAQGRCVNNTCLSATTHAGQVASRISASDSGDRCHAAEATIVVANDNTSVLEPVDLARAYQDFVDRDVSIVNESWGWIGGRQFTALDYVRDWYARYEGVTYVKASGNSSGIVDCHALNAMCVGSTDALGTYDVFLDDNVSRFSDWRNPLYAAGRFTAEPLSPKEVERPDVVSEGGNARTIGTNQESWGSNSGTSFAAPTVSGLVALLDEECGPFSPATHRAAFRTAAFTPQTLEDPGDPFYPTPGASPDSLAGAGINDARWMRLYCDPQPGDPELLLEEGDIDPADPGTWFEPEDWMLESEPDEELVIRHGDIEVSQRDLKSSDIVVTPLWEVGSARRVRVTFSFYTCPGVENEEGEFAAHESREDYPDPVGPPVIPNINAPAVDFDIMLCSESAEECIAVSESFDDTNEGFDVRLDESRAEHSDWVVHLIQPQSALDSGGCQGPQDGFEPWGSAIAVWR